MQAKVGCDSNKQGREHVAADDTRKKQIEPYRFQPGQSGNPAGRPKGARSKLGEAFLAALHLDFEANGIEAIRRAREEKPDQYLKVIASLLPREVTLSFEDELGHLSDDELLGRVRSLQANLGLLLASE